MVERIAYRLVVHRGFRAVAVLGQDRWLRFRIVSVLLGLLLLTAAVLKTHQLATEPVLGTGLLESRWVVTAVVQYELLLGFWLFSGLFRRAVWWAAVTTFAAFAVVVVGKALAGDDSCGCFGRLSTSPWLVLMVDVCTIVLLLACAVRPNQWTSSAFRVPDQVGRTEYTTTTFGYSRRTLGLASSFWLVLAVGLGIIGHRGAPSDSFGRVGRRFGSLIVVEPHRMLGQWCELADFIDVGAQLTKGHWLVVLYRADCSDCRSLFSRWHSGAGPLHRLGNVALVSVPPHGGDEVPEPLLGVLSGKLTDERRWFVQTPLFMSIKDGMVLGIYHSDREAIRALSGNVIEHGGHWSGRHRSTTGVTRDT